MMTISRHSSRLRGSGPGLARVRGAGLTLHSHLPGRPGLTVGSTSVFGLRATPGDLPVAVPGEVERGIEVAVRDHAARGAYVGAIGEGQLGFRCSAARAGLAGGEPPVRDDHPAAVPGRLVLQLPAD